MAAGEDTEIPMGGKEDGSPDMDHKLNGPHPEQESICVGVCVSMCVCEHV